MQRTPLDNCASFDPATLKILTTAFDEAWPSAVGRCKSHLNLQVARERLAIIILDLGLRGERDVETIKTCALERFEQYQQHATA